MSSPQINAGRARRRGLKVQAACRRWRLESQHMSHVPFWFAQFPKSRRSSYPRLRGEHITRVVIVGGGLTGASCALACAAAGLDPVLLEASAIGGGMTAG